MNYIYPPYLHPDMCVSYVFLVFVRASLFFVYCFC